MPKNWSCNSCCAFQVAVLSQRRLNAAALASSQGIANLCYQGFGGRQKTLREGRAQTKSAHAVTSFLLWPASRPSHRHRAGRRQTCSARSRRRLTATALPAAAALPPNPHSAHLLSGTHSRSTPPLPDPPETPAEDSLSTSGRPAAQITTTSSYSQSRPVMSLSHSGSIFAGKALLNSQYQPSRRLICRLAASLPPAYQGNACRGRMGSCRQRCSCHPTAASCEPCLQTVGVICRMKRTS